MFNLELTSCCCVTQPPLLLAVVMPLVQHVEDQLTAAVVERGTVGKKTRRRKSDNKGDELDTSNSSPNKKTNKKSKRSTHEK